MIIKYQIIWYTLFIYESNETEYEGVKRIR